MEQSLHRLRQALTLRQLLVLQSRQLSFHPVKNWASDESTSEISQLSTGTRPEQIPSSNNSLKFWPGRCRIVRSSQLLIRLRFEEGLTLQRISQLTGIKDAQTTDRKIKSILEEIEKSIK